jgi:predicted nucleic acid-binding protein
MILLDTSVLVGYFRGFSGELYDRLAEFFEKAAENYHRCRKKGVTVRSTIDMLIAQTAIENDLYLMHNDNDFRNMATVIKELKLLQV